MVFFILMNFSSLDFDFCFFNVGKYLILGDDAQENWNSIAQFSVKDANAFVKYEEFLGMYLLSHLQDMQLEINRKRNRLKMYRVRKYGI